ncbi:MAG TPA: hypothetical protein ENJ32_00825 [Crenotrichaceae bacterium]|nr:hypothetical protein [Crenotrichaceae bacterium]
MNCSRFRILVLSAIFALLAACGGGGNGSGGGVGDSGPSGGGEENSDSNPQKDVGWLWSNPLPQGNTLFSVTSGNGRIVAVGNYGRIISSTNGTDWNIHDPGISQELHFVEWTGSEFVAVGSDGNILRSTD